MADMSLIDSIYKLRVNTKIVLKYINEMCLESEELLLLGYTFESMTIGSLKQWQYVLSIYEASLEKHKYNRISSYEEALEIATTDLWLANSIRGDWRFIREMNLVWSRVWRLNTLAEYKELISLSEIIITNSNNSLNVVADAILKEALRTPPKD